MSTQAFIKGFVKRASEKGLTEQQAVSILKQANMWHGLAQGAGQTMANITPPSMLQDVANPDDASAAMMLMGGAGGAGLGGAVGGLSGLVAPNRDERGNPHRMSSMFQRGLGGAALGGLGGLAAGGLGAASAQADPSAYQMGFGKEVVGDKLRALFGQ